MNEKAVPGNAPGADTRAKCGFCRAIHPTSAAAIACYDSHARRPEKREAEYRAWCDFVGIPSLVRHRGFSMTRWQKARRIASNFLFFGTLAVILFGLWWCERVRFVL